MKITDPHYSLPIIIAESIVEELEAGTTRPLVVKGRDNKEYTFSHYVAKPIRAPRMSEVASLSELIGSFMASQLDLRIPAPAIIQITPAFCELYRGHDMFSILQNSIGLNFGSQYIRGFNIWNNDRLLINKLHKELLNIFIFDMLIENGDRRTDKPNMLTNREVIYILDHEQAFGFLLSVSTGISATPWFISPADRFIAENHILYPHLRGKEFVSEDFFLINSII